MAEEQLVYYHSGGVRRTAFYSCDTPETFSVKTEVDVTSLIDTNKALADIHPQRSTNKLVARIPLTIYERSIHENWDEDDWKKWLNDPDNAVFRVWKGKV